MSTVDCFGHDRFQWQRGQQNTLIQLPRRLRDLEAKYGETEVPITGSARVYRKEPVDLQLAIEKTPMEFLLARLCWLDPSIKQSKGGINVIQFSVYTLELENKKNGIS